MSRAKEIKGTLVAIATFLIRPSIFLILGLAAGYAIGYVDAFRESDTLGNKVARAVYRMHPEALSEGVKARASVIRDTLQERIGVADPVPPPY
jgi:hypothetical protein